MQNDKAKFKKEFIRRLICYSINVIKYCNSLRKNRNYWPIADQVMRSSTSIGANVVEAQSSSSKRDYIRFFEIALKSANETKYWFLVIRETFPNLRNKTSFLLKEADEISKIIASSVLTLKGKK